MNNMEESIFVLSLEANDHIYQKLEGAAITKQGGPAFYIKQTFDKLGTNYKMAGYESAEVEIKITEEGEVGRIIKPGKIYLPKTIKEPNLLISTIAPSNLDLAFLESYQGQVFLDVQGFVRCEESQHLGSKKVWNRVGDVLSYLSVVKMDAKEIHFIPLIVLQDLKSKIFIKTKGKKGVDIWQNGQKYSFKVPRIINRDHTIGAGDSFFAAFIHQFVNGQDIEPAIRFALEYAASFLEKEGRKNEIRTPCEP